MNLACWGFLYVIECFKLNWIDIKLFHITGRAVFSGKWIGVFHTLSDRTLNSEFLAQFAHQAEENSTEHQDIGRSGVSVAVV